MVSTRSRAAAASTTTDVKAPSLSDITNVTTPTKTTPTKATRGRKPKATEAVAAAAFTAPAVPLQSEEIFQNVASPATLVPEKTDIIYISDTDEQLGEMIDDIPMPEDEEVAAAFEKAAAEEEELPEAEISDSKIIQASNPEVVASPASAELCNIDNEEVKVAARVHIRFGDSEDDAVVETVPITAGLRAKTPEPFLEEDLESLTFGSDDEDYEEDSPQKNRRGLLPPLQAAQKWSGNHIRFETAVIQEKQRTHTFFPDEDDTLDALTQSIQSISLTKN